MWLNFKAKYNINTRAVLRPRTTLNWSCRSLSVDVRSCSWCWSPSSFMMLYNLPHLCYRHCNTTHGWFPTHWITRFQTTVSAIKLSDDSIDTDMLFWEKHGLYTLVTWHLICHLLSVSVQRNQGCGWQLHSSYDMHREMEWFSL